MIDIHAHILPGLDDGAEDMYETLEMAKMAVDSGLTAVVATPHCNIPGMYDNYFGKEYVHTFRRTQQRLEEEGIPLTLCMGMEVFVTPDVNKLAAEKKIITLNGSRYMLVEFDFGEEAGYVQEMLEKIKACGIYPIIAHPERYGLVQKRPELVYQWCKQGYLVQVNKGSLLGRFGRRAQATARKLLSHNLVTTIASDAHGFFERTPWMLEVYDKLSGKYPEKYLKVLFEENPKRICQNQPTIRFELKPFDEESVW